MSDSTKPVPVRTSFTADEIDTIYNDLWAAGYVLHCTDIEDGEVVVSHGRPVARDWRRAARHLPRAVRTRRGRRASRR